MGDLGGHHKVPRMTTHSAPWAEDVLFVVLGLLAPPVLWSSAKWIPRGGPVAYQVDQGVCWCFIPVRAVPRGWSTGPTACHGDGPLVLLRASG